MATIACFELEPFEKAYLKKKLSRHKLIFVDKPLTSRNASYYKDADIIVIFIFSEINKKVLDKFSKLRCIATMSTGYDHIDVQAATSKKISVCTVPFYGQNTVAEHAFALLLSLNRHIVQAVSQTKKHSFNYHGLRGRDLAGKTLGVVGAGHIGQYMIHYAKAFGMKVIVYDAHKNPRLAKKENYTYVTLQTLCKQSDFISLHLPLFEQTRHIIGEKEISLMKSDAFIINTARGALIDTDALVRALDEKRIAGCALDVLEYECDQQQKRIYSFVKHPDPTRLKICVENHELMNRDNVIITPHLGFYTDEALRRILDTTVENIKGCIKKSYTNKVN